MRRAFVGTDSAVRRLFALSRNVFMQAQARGYMVCVAAMIETQRSQ
jgi:hypothetical protein